MDIERLSKLMDWMNSTPLSEFEWKDGKEHIKLVKTAAAASDVSVQSSSAPLVPAAPEESGSKEDLVLAPFMGVAHLSPEPDTADYVKPGSKVAEGDTLCTIEAMKIFNAVQAPHAGVVEEVLVKPGEQVSLDQPLFRLVKN
ncbi:acetyl-CoA carboxylase biotin carboxyl carrier protein [Roseibium suaedae]|nr:biotin/lipoyl-containing protein [Roseibium suaedae]